MDDGLKIEALPGGIYKATVGTKQKIFHDMTSAAEWAIAELYSQEGEEDG